MHCEIIDHYFNVFFVKILLKKDNWKSFFGHPNWYTGLPNGLNTSLSKLATMLKMCCVTDLFQGTGPKFTEQLL